MFVSIIILFFSGVGCFILGSLLGYQYGIHHLVKKSKNQDVDDKKLFLERLSFEVSHHKVLPKMIVIIKVSLNNFKEVLALYGQDFADQYAQELILRLKKICSDSTVVSRTQTDEISTLESGFKSISDVLNFVYQLRSGLGASYEYKNQLVIGSLSVGVALYPNDSDKMMELYDFASLALQSCIRQKTEYEFYKKSMNQQVKVQKSLINDLYEAVKSEQFYLAYQPQIAIQENNKLVGAEVLIRWDHPTRGPISPAEFIPLAEEAGFIYKIDEWVLAQSCKQSAVWQRNGWHLKLAVNISGDHFNQKSFIAKVSQCISKFGVNPSLLELEITETAMMLEWSTALKHMNEIKSMGLSLALDDFGTGYSSLGYLRQFPIDKLKIEASFIKHIIENKSDRALTKGIIHLGHDLGLTVLAEAVENQAQLEVLMGFGCDIIQGYYFSKPLPTKVFEKYVKNYLANLST